MKSFSTVSNQWFIQRKPKCQRMEIVCTLSRLLLLGALLSRGRNTSVLPTLESYSDSLAHARITILSTCVDLWMLYLIYYKVQPHLQTNDIYKAYCEPTRLSSEIYYLLQSYRQSRPLKSCTKTSKPATELIFTSTNDFSTMYHRTTDYCVDLKPVLPKSYPIHIILQNIEYYSNCWHQYICIKMKIININIYIYI